MKIEIEISDDDLVHINRFLEQANQLDPDANTHGRHS